MARFGLIFLILLSVNVSSLAHAEYKVGHITTVKPSEMVPPAGYGNFWLVVGIFIEKVRTSKGTETIYTVPGLTLKLVAIQASAIQDKLEKAEKGGYLSGGTPEFDQIVSMDHTGKLQVEFYASSSGMIERTVSVGEESISLKHGESFPQLPEGYFWELATPYDSVYEFQPGRTIYVLAKEDPDLPDQVTSVSNLGRISARNNKEFLHMALCFGELSELSTRH